jgi:general secretion pathway protein B
MSYILDALKKSAEERRRVQKPTPLLYDPSASGSTTDYRRKGLFVQVMAIVSLCLTALAATAWYWHHAQQSPIEMPSSSLEQSQQETRSGPAAIPDTSRTPLKLPQTESGRPNLLPAMPDQPAATVPSEMASPSFAAFSAPLLEQLPPAVQVEIPAIKFSGHVFSAEPSLRMIMANQTIVRERDLVAPDIRLEEITETGVLLDYRGTRFRIELLPSLNATESIRRKP